jgi:uncharacterized protein (TIGR03437 family)
MKCDVDLRDPADSESLQLAIASSSADLKVPATIGARKGLSRLRFEVSADPNSTFEIATLEARLGAGSVQTSVTIEPPEAPGLTAPAEVSSTPQMPVHFQVRGLDYQGLGVTLSAANLPPGAVFEPDEGVFEWTPAAGDLGTYKLLFTATSPLDTATTKVVNLSIDSGSPRLTKLENGAGGTAPAACSPGSVATLRGHSLFAGAVPAADWSGASSQLSGTRILVNGDYAAILYASAERVDLLCPVVAPGTALDIAVETAAGLSNALRVSMETAAPGLFTRQDSETLQAIAMGADSLDLAAVPSERLNGKPALPGDVLAFDATGFECSADSAAALSMQVGSDLMPVIAVNPAPGRAGICRVQVSVPASADGDAVPVTLQVTGKDGLKRTSNQGTISVASRL